MKRPARYWLTYIYTGPYDVLSWLVLLLMWTLWGTKLHWLEGVWFELKEGSWPTRTWYKGWAGTTVGHGGFLAPGRAGGEGIDTDTEFHEHVHIEQYEGSMLFSFICGIVTAFVLWSLGYPIVAIVTGGIMWMSGSVLGYATASIQAWLRGEKGYRGNVKEEAAYAITAQRDDAEILK